MSIKLINNGLYIKKSPIQGYGVFAGHEIKKGEVVEEARVLVYEQGKSLDFNNYRYILPGKKSGIVLGNGTIYNHSRTPNVDFSFDINRGLMVYTALQPIRLDEELYIDYGDKWFSSRNISERDPSRYQPSNRMVKFILVGVVISTIILSVDFLMKV